MSYWEPAFLKDMVAYIDNPNVSMYIRRDHKADGEGGVDLTSPGGTEVYALADGNIIGLGYFCHGGPFDNPTPACANGRPGYGVVTTRVEIPGYGTNDLYYQHIMLDPSLKMGAQVIRGQKLGTIVSGVGEIEIGLNAGTPSEPWGAIWGGDNHPAAWADDPRPQIKALMALGTPTGKASSGGDMVDITLKEFLNSVIIQMRNNAGQLNTLGGGPSQSILNFVISWAHWEGGSQTNACKFNVCNTMQEETGAVQCEGALPSIKSYPDATTGEKAMIDALNNGLYNNLKHALSTNDENNLGFHGNAMATNIAGDLSMWKNGSRTIDADYCFKIMSGAGISNARIANGAGGQNLIWPVSSQATIDKWGAVVIGQGVDNSSSSNNPLDALGQLGQSLQSLGNFFSGLNSFLQDPTRLVKILLGAVLIIASLVLVIKELTPAPIKKAAKTLGAFA